jgi:O-succinylbenzoic acid--CoA ligase
MTETASHIALKSIFDTEFQVLGDTSIRTTEQEALRLKGSITNHQWLETNDVVEILSDSTFRWRGRIDFVINTGGVKVSPEEVEKKIIQLNKDVDPFITYLESPELGQQIVLVTTQPNKPIDLSNLNRYEKPKMIYYLPAFAFTNNQKIDRIKTRKLLLASLKNSD